MGLKWSLTDPEMAKTKGCSPKYALFTVSTDVVGIKHSPGALRLCLMKPL